jgi:hypothetical protein
MVLARDCRLDMMLTSAAGARKEESCPGKAGECVLPLCDRRWRRCLERLEELCAAMRWWCWEEETQVKDEEMKKKRKRNRSRHIKKAKRLPR